MIIQGADGLRADWIWVGGKVAGCGGGLVGVLIVENPLHMHARPMVRIVTASGKVRQVVFFFVVSILPPGYHEKGEEKRERWKSVDWELGNWYADGDL